MLLFILATEALSLAVLIALSYLVRASASFGVVPGGTISLSAAHAVLLGLLHGAVALATLLVGPIILAGDRPRVVAAFREYFRILRHQPGRLAAVAAIYAAAITVIYLGIIPLRLAFRTTRLNDPFWFLYVPTLVHWWLNWACALGLSHVAAALLRAAYGLPLTPTGPAQRSAAPLAPLRLAGDVRSARPNASQKAAGVGDSSDDPPAPDGSTTGEPASDSPDSASRFPTGGAS